MKKIETTAPISIENLKKYFVDNEIFYVIDYENSTLKGSKLLTYLSNLDVPCDLNINENDIYDLMVDYFNSPMILNIKTLEEKAIEILIQYKYETENYSEKNENFIENNQYILAKWISLIESLTLYNMYTFKNEDSQNLVKLFPIIENDDLKGINFVSLLKHENFYDLMNTIDEKNLFFYKHYFEESCFKGKPLFDYWSNGKNSLFLLTFGLSQGLIKFNDYGIPELIES